MIREILFGATLGLCVVACGGPQEPEQTGVASVDDLAPESSTGTAAVVAESSTTSVAVSIAEDAEEMSPIEEQELALLDVSACMRDEGITDFPDVGVDNDGAIDIAAVFQSGVNPQSREFIDAFEVCGSLVGDVTFGARALPDTGQIVDQLFGFTDCVRAEGIDVGDVGIAELLDRRASVPADVSSREEGIAYFFDLDPKDPAVLAAIDVCDGELAGLPGANG